MSATAVSEGDLVGLSALLYTLTVHNQVTQSELFAICSGYGLRGGAIRWEVAFKIASDMRFLGTTDGRVALSEIGSAMTQLVTADMEPTDEFAHAVLSFAIGRSNARFTLATAAIDGQTIQDPRGMASPLLEDLVEVGLLAATTPGEWQLQESQFAPLLIGLLFGSPKGSPVASEVGRLGEQLTLRYYRDQGWSPLHVAPISDTYGFDILCRGRSGAHGSLAVEAKATTAQLAPYRFFASRHELRVARYLGASYEIALWGELDVAASLDDNYTRLRSKGFPRVITDPFAHVETHARGLLTGLPVTGGTVFADGLVWHHP